MQTRSKTMTEMHALRQPHYETADRSSIIQQELTVDIDFDEASRAWTQNKQRRGASYYYICGHVLANGIDTCKHPAKKGIYSTFYCHKHSQE